VPDYVQAYAIFFFSTYYPTQHEAVYVSSYDQNENLYHLQRRWLYHLPILPWEPFHPLPGMQRQWPRQQWQNMHQLRRRWRTALCHLQGRGRGALRDMQQHRRQVSRSDHPAAEDLLRAGGAEGGEPWRNAREQVAWGKIEELRKD
jgi:hypothetical protein